jgi:hypothetical protein
MWGTAGQSRMWDTSTHPFAAPPACTAAVCHPALTHRQARTHVLLLFLLPPAVFAAASAAATRLCPVTASPASACGTLALTHPPQVYHHELLMFLSSPTAPVAARLCPVTASPVSACGTPQTQQRCKSGWQRTWAVTAGQSCMRCAVLCATAVWLVLPGVQSSKSRTQVAGERVDVMVTAA